MADMHSDNNGQRADPAGDYSDMQWFMFRQGNVAHYAAFSSRSYDAAALAGLARELIRLAPQLARTPGGENPLPAFDQTTLRRLISIRHIADFGGFPEFALNERVDVLSRPGLPMFRISAFVRDGGPDAEQRAAFLVVRVAHALVEGADSALLSRSQSALHPISRSRYQSGRLLTAVASVLGVLAAGAHLVLGNVAQPRPGPYGFATRVYPRRLFTSLAHELGIRQRALFFALVMHTLFGAGTPAGKRHITATYSTIDSGGGTHHDNYMRMRMLFARFANAADFFAFARAVDERLREGEGKESGFNAEFTAAGLHFHRKMSGIIGFAYRPQLFAFMPYDIVIGLIPPHRLGGRLTAGLLEPIYAGATTPGANACVIVPGQQCVSFNFYIQHKLIANLAALDALLEGNAVKAGFRQAPPDG